MKIAIIDDGIIAEKCPVRTLVEDVEVGLWGHIRKRRASSNSQSLHGTIIAAIINKYTTHAEFCSVKIFNMGLNTTLRRLVAGLRWCYRKRIPIVHLSLGTTDERDFPVLEKIIHKMMERGQIIVAACKGETIISMPSNHPDVISVIADANLYGFAWRTVGERRDKFFAASSRHSVEIDGKMIITPICNSFAAPTITAALIEENYFKPSLF